MLVGGSERRIDDTGDLRKNHRVVDGSGSNRRGRESLAIHGSIPSPLVGGNPTVQRRWKRERTREEVVRDLIPEVAGPLAVRHESEGYGRMRS